MAETTNTSGVIAAAAQKQNAPANKPKSPANIMRGILDSEATKQLLRDSLKESAGAFSASIIDLYNSDKTLQTCDPKQVFAECLKAVSLKLPINKQLGFAYVIPFKDHGTPVPQFQIGYKGMIQLCMRTGAYKYINTGIVYDGELTREDKLTGEILLDGERKSDKIIGYFAYIETLNGFKKTLYWTKEKVIEHGKRFSKTFNSNYSVWKTDFDAMAIKTVLRNLLSHYGVMSVEMMSAMTAEEVPADVADPSEADDMIIETTAEVPAETAPTDDEDYPFGNDI